MANKIAFPALTPIGASAVVKPEQPYQLSMTQSSQGWVFAGAEEQKSFHLVMKRLDPEHSVTWYDDEYPNQAEICEAL